MSREVIVVTVAYGREKVVELGGQQALLPVIAQAGADGVEIRRELFSEPELQNLPALGQAIRDHNLVAFYSVPEPLFNPAGELTSNLQHYFSEAAQLNARLIKFSLGHYQPGTRLSELKERLSRQSIRLVVENDQTADCGILPALSAFFQDVTDQRLPLEMTFDMANWHWVDESPLTAVQQLSQYVGYIHVKAAIASQKGWRAIALDDADNLWQALLAQLPSNAPRGIEFPLEGNDLTAVTRHYVNIVKKD